MDEIYPIEGDDLECDEEDEQACNTCPIYQTWEDERER